MRRIEARREDEEEVFSVCALVGFGAILNPEMFCDGKELIACNINPLFIFHYYRKAI
jgi:hypothetical protein